VFESQPALYATASVYVPSDLAGPAPAVLCPHGHWRHGRYQDVVQRRCVGLARRGYVTLSIDAVGYNDRLAQGHRRAWYLFSAGRTLQGIEIWDNMRAIDYLCSRPDVDPERIGCTGCSGGGNQTMYVSALDERIKASVPVCSVEVVADYMEKGFCTCEAVPAEVRVADLTEVCGLIAPRALLLIHGMLDSGFPILSARKAAARIRDIYSFYAPERFGTYESYSEHDYNEEMRRAMYAWFDRWLMGNETHGEEEEPGEAALRVLPEGLPAGHASLASIFVSEAQALPSYPEPADAQTWEMRRQYLSARLPVLLGGFPLRGDLDVRVTGAEQRKGYSLERFWFRCEPDVLLPAVYLAPTGQSHHGVALYVLEGGKSMLSQQEAEAQLAKGLAVMAFDPRGTGETEYDLETAFLSAFALGRPLLGMHAWDAIRCVDYLKSRSDVRGIHLIGRGSPAAAMAALLAAALDRRVASLSVDALPATLRLPIEDREMDQVYLPNLLELTDVAEIAAMIAPRPLSVGKLLADGLEPLPADVAPQAFDLALRTYGLLGAPEALSLG